MPILSDLAAVLLKWNKGLHSSNLSWFANNFARKTFGFFNFKPPTVINGDQAKTLPIILGGY